jgi:hypothetical protein
MTDAIDKRLRICPELIGMQQSGRLEPLPAYTAIAETSAAQVERTGRLGIATLCSGHQLVGQHFPGFASTARGAKWLGRTLPVAISEQHVCADPKVLMTRAEPDNARLVALPLLASAIMARLTTPDLPATSLTSWPT